MTTKTETIEPAVLARALLRMGPGALAQWLLDGCPLTFTANDGEKCLLGTYLAAHGARASVSHYDLMLFRVDGMGNEFLAEDAPLPLWARGLPQWFDMRFGHYVDGDTDAETVEPVAAHEVLGALLLAEML